MALTKRACFLAVLLVLLCARSGRADNLFNNISNVTTGSDPAGDLFGPLADSFSTGSSSFLLDSVSILLSNQSSAFGLPSCSGVACGTTTIFLLSDSSDSPGGVIETIGSLNNSLLTGTPQDFTFATSVDLQPNTRYWIEVTSTDNNSWWAFDGGGDGEFFANFEGTGNWIVTSDSAGQGGAYQMEVSGGSSVPEPSAVSLLFVGLAVFAFFAAVRRKYQVCTNPL
jgi:hypothetical protein